MASTRSREGSVWIAENADEGDSMLLTGRFSGHLDRGDRITEKFDDLSADEAIAWGRARSAVVLIRTGDSGYYSAGEHNPDPDEYLPWPPTDLRLEPRRPRGFEALDNTETDPPVLWDVRASVNLDRKPDARVFHEAVRAQPAAAKVQAPAPGYPPTSAAFVVEASTESQARRIADDIAEKAFHALVEALGSHDSFDTFSCGTEVYPHRPGVVVRGPGITY